MIEVKTNLSSVRDFRNALLQLVHVLARAPEKHGYLLLINPIMGKESLESEFRATWSALRPEIAQRLNYVVAKDENSSDEVAALPISVRHVLAQEEGRPGRDQIQLGRPDMQSEVLRVLILSWVEGRGLLTSDGLAKAAGCSYRTVAGTLQKLGPAIERGAGRRVQLRYFPTEAWHELAVTAKRSRGTILYTDESNQPRSISSLYKRIVALQRPDLAFGGTIGALRHRPNLDLVGAPRLDLCVHAHEKSTVLLPLDRIDPGLKETQNPTQPVRLAVHFLRRRESFFSLADDGFLVADPVECLLDLYDGRLMQQATEFMNQLEAEGKTRNARP